MKVILKLLLAAILLTQGYLAFEIFSLNREAREHSQDLIELSKVKYGLFTVDVWKEKISAIVSDKIDQFEITDENRAEMRVTIRTFLYEQVDRFERNYKARNKESLGGLLRSAVAGLTNTFEEIKTEVPAITDQIIHFLDDPENRKNLKGFISAKLDEYTDETFAETDYTLQDAILAKYDADTRADAFEIIQEKSESLNERKDILLKVSGGLYSLVVLILLFGWKTDKWSMTLMILYTTVLLSLGVLLPMIEIDARIEELSFSLMGTKLSFTDQVLYYKNKSILEVVKTLAENGKADLIAVAILVFIFSVLFPFLKLSSSLVYLFKSGAEKWKFIRFMVFKTGKWSMADVMVVAIFMAYIGFSGIVTEQLSQLKNISTTVDILTTNNSSLKEGFFLFTGFVLLSILISTKIDRAIAK
ncbi:MAG: paraquat-inducible protein A [Cryomorphaceae bacterium]